MCKALCLGQFKRPMTKWTEVLPGSLKIGGPLHAEPEHAPKICLPKSRDPKPDINLKP